MNLFRLGSGTGPGSKFGTEAIIDAMRGSLRFSINPMDYSDISGNVLGFYRATAITGTTVSVGAAGILAYLRWSDTSRVMVLRKVELQALVASTITTGVQVDAGLYIARGSSAAGSGGGAITLSGNNNKLRGAMGSSLITDARVATTAALTAPTGATADSNPIAALVTTVSFQTTAPASGTTGVANTVTPVSTLYAYDSPAQHPVVLAAGDVLEIQEISAGPTTGGIKWYFTFEWAELASF